MDWMSDENASLLETDLESSDESDDEGDDDGDNDIWKSWGNDDSDLLKHPFTVQNLSVHFPEHPDQEMMLLKVSLPTTYCMNLSLQPMPLSL